MHMKHVHLALLERGWHSALAQLVAESTKYVLVAAPYITGEGSRVILNSLPTNVCRTGQLYLLTDLSPSHICDGSLEPAAIGELCDSVTATNVWHIPRLHAKVYIADGVRALVTSGNLTAAGMFHNLEYGVDIHDPAHVKTILDHLAFYQATGTAITRSQLAKYETAALVLRDEYRSLRRSASATATKAFRTAMRQAEDELVRLKLGGGALHTVFARTIEFLLRKYGPLSTVQIHDYVKALHPELCDDAIDRVIDGVHFGKKWKHAVRTSQQMLKKRGSIHYANKVWRSSVGDN